MGALYVVLILILLLSVTSVRRAFCRHCRDFLADSSHGHEHRRLCCDCYDLSWGMPLEDINEERAEKGLPPIAKPWPEVRL